MAEPATATSASGISHTTTSEVRNTFATDTEFSRQQRITLVGSMMPRAMRSTNSPLLASNPKLVSLLALTFSMVVMP